MSDKRIKIKQATKKGYIEMDLGGCATSVIRQANFAEVVCKEMVGFAQLSQQLPVSIE